MDQATLAAFEARAASAEQRLAVLEAKLQNGKGESLLAMCRIPSPRALPSAFSELPEPWGRAKYSEGSEHTSLLMLKAPLLWAQAYYCSVFVHAGNGNSVNVSQYVAGLQELRGLLVMAKAEQERLEKELAEV